MVNFWLISSIQAKSVINSDHPLVDAAKSVSNLKKALKTKLAELYHKLALNG